MQNTCGSHCLWGAIMQTIGFFLIVAGFIAQTSSGAFINWTALLYYLIGFMLWGCGRHKADSGSSMAASKSKKRKK